MNTKNLSNVVRGLVEKMESDGYSESIIKTTQWIINHFQNYCNKHGMEEVSVADAVDFLNECFGFDYYNTTNSTQNVIRRPLLILFEFEESGNYLRTHQKCTHTDIPLAFKDIFLSYRETVNKRNLVHSTKVHKLWEFEHHFKFLADNGVESIKNITFQHVYDYFNKMKKDYSHQTIVLTKTNIREIYNWLYDNRYISFSGQAVLPYIRSNRRSKLISYYSKKEIDQLLSCINTDVNYGKCVYSVICLLAHLGIRAGDIITLRFSDIDWENNRINIVQQKTGSPLTLPLVDEVKYPLIDYIKNGRPESNEEEYIFITINAPHQRYLNSSAIHRMVTKCMKIAGIEYEGRHHGPHALRHSLATSLMNENVPISSIANILGHRSTRTTEVYLTVDETHLKELSLEVPHE